jgi:hypothetical protein
METRPGRIVARLFWTLWLFIILVSVFDGYLAIRHRRELLEFELNPIGRFLLSQCGGVSCLVGAKFAGTVVACAALLLLQRTKPRWSIVVVSLLAGLQLALLLYLLVA